MAINRRACAKLRRALSQGDEHLSSGERVYYDDNGVRYVVDDEKRRVRKASSGTYWNSALASRLHARSDLVPGVWRKVPPQLFQCEGRPSDLPSHQNISVLTAAAALRHTG